TETVTIETGQSLTIVKSTEDTPMEKQTEEGTIRIGAYGSDYVTSSLGAVGHNNVLAVSCIYDTLFRKDFRTGEITPLIAESYEFIDDPEGEGVTLHITIRPEAHFQSGEPITAEDAYYAVVDRVINVGSVRSYMGDTIDTENSYFEGDRDLYIKLYKYNNTVLGFLTALVVQVSNHSFEETATDDDLWDKVDGSGPFIVVEQISGDSVKLKVDDNYWGWGIVDERPNFDYISAKFYTDATVMMIDYENGLLDVCLGPGSADVKSLLKNGMAHNETKVITTGNYTVICLPAYRKEFSDPKVREAMFCAIDTDAIAEAAYGDLGVPMNAYVSSMAPYRKEYKTNKYDPERARQLLSEAGIKEGQLSYYTVVPSNDAGSVDLATLVQSYLGDVGITVNIDTFDFPTALQMQRNGTVDLCITTFYTSNNDISGCLVQIREGSYNQAAWLTQMDPELLSKMNEGLYTDSPEVAEAAYGWVQDWLDENMWYIPIVEYKAGAVCRDYIDSTNFLDLTHSNDIRNIRLAE
ncbi:MAG: ABC transporter substrate-binding protein, partial [Firmicutes bacterium]|nr:ABC transporter substrate-binding protein [Bacillota bacterium]